MQVLRQNAGAPMSTLNIRVTEEKRKKLKVLASSEGKTMSGLVSELIDNYVDKATQRLQENGELHNTMKVSEPSFSEWDNEEDGVYNDL